jgi:ABC-type microcin C transport system duplicated ATPase subunit YejF
MSLLRLLPPSAKVEGTAQFDGIDLLSAPAREIRRIRGREIAFVFQEPMTSLNPSFRVGRQIA